MKIIDGVAAKAFGVWLGKLSNHTKDCYRMGVQKFILVAR
jgi:hypothetical protein